MSKAYGQNIVAKNRMAVREGITRAADMNKWHKSHDIKKRVVKGSKRDNRSGVPVRPGACYGKPSKESEHVPELLSAAVLTMPDRGYPDMSNQRVPGRLPLPRATASSEKLQQHNMRAMNPKAGSDWQMSKFRNVGARIDRYGREKALLGGGGGMGDSLADAIDDIVAADEADKAGVDAGVDEGKMGEEVKG